MPRKPIDAKGLADVTRHLMNQGIGDLETKGLTEEEEEAALHVDSLDKE